MLHEYDLAYEVGDVLYTMEGGKVETYIIKEIKITGWHKEDSIVIEPEYKVVGRLHTYRYTESSVNKVFCTSKAALIKRIADTMEE